MNDRWADLGKRQSTIDRSGFQSEKTAEQKAREAESTSFRQKWDSIGHPEREKRVAVTKQEQSQNDDADLMSERLTEAEWNKRVHDRDQKRMIAEKNERIANEIARARGLK